MNIILSVTIGFLVFIGVLQILHRDVVRVVVGLYILWNAANIIIISSSRLHGRRAPVVGLGEGPMTDPLVQAMVLTAIVITFGFVAFLIASSYWLSKKGNSIDLSDFMEGRN